MFSFVGGGELSPDLAMLPFYAFFNSFPKNTIFFLVLQINHRNGGGRSGGEQYNERHRKYGRSKTAQPQKKAQTKVK